MKKKIIAFAVLILLLSAGGISAYFTASDEASNRWTVGNVSIELLEEEYDKVPETERQNITPNKTFTKDPVVRNTGTVSYTHLDVYKRQASWTGGWRSSIRKTGRQSAGGRMLAKRRYRS